HRVTGGNIAAGTREGRRLKELSAQVGGEPPVQTEEQAAAAAEAHPDFLLGTITAGAADDLAGTDAPREIPRDAAASGNDEPGLHESERKGQGQRIIREREDSAA